jgi:hypothetical protein
MSKIVERESMKKSGSVANNLFNLKKVEYPIIAKTRFVVFARFFEFVGE